MLVINNVRNKLIQRTCVCIKKTKHLKLKKQHKDVHFYSFALTWLRVDRFI